MLVTESLQFNLVFCSTYTSHSWSGSN